MGASKGDTQTKWGGHVNGRPTCIVCLSSYDVYESYNKFKFKFSLLISSKHQGLQSNNHTIFTNEQK